MLNLPPLLAIVTRIRDFHRSLFPDFIAYLETQNIRTPQHNEGSPPRGGGRRVVSVLPLAWSGMDLWKFGMQCASPSTPQCSEDLETEFHYSYRDMGDG